MRMLINPFHFISFPSRLSSLKLQITDYNIPTPINEAINFDTTNINHEIVHTYVDISERVYTVNLFEVKNGGTNECDISSPILPGDGISIYSQTMDCEPGCNYDGSTTNLKVYLNVEQETVFTNHNIWSMNDDGTVATLQYCIRVDLYADMDNDGTITKDYRSYESVSFLEVKNTVTLNMAVGVNVDESIQPLVNDQDLLLFSGGGGGTDYTLRTMWIAPRDMPCTFDSTAATAANYGESSDQKMALLCITTNAPSNLIRIKDIVNLSLQQGDTTITITTGPNDNMVIVDNGSTSASDGGEGSSGIVVHFEALDPILFQLLASSSTTTTTNDERMEVTVKGTVIIDLYNDDEKMEQQLVGNNLRGSGTQEQQLLQQQQQLSSSLTESEQTFEAPKLVLQRSPNSAASSSSSSASSSPSSSRYSMWLWITVVASIATFIVF